MLTHAKIRLTVYLLAICFVPLGFVWGQQQNPQYIPKRPTPYPAPNPLLPKPAHSAPTPAGDSRSDSARFRDWRVWAKVQGFTIDGDHEDAGVMITPISQNVYGGIYAKHIVYPENSIKLNLPAGGIRAQTLYAATTRPPNGSCLEVGTAYTTQPNVDASAIKTIPVLYVYDFCAAGGGNFVKGPDADTGILIDQQFIDKYAQANAQGMQAYEMQIFTRDYPISSNSTWYAQLRNKQTGNWETLYSDKGQADDNRGWSIFETYYQQGQCSESLPILGVDQVSLLNTRTGVWELLSGSMPLLRLRVDQGGEQNDNCFVADSTGPATYIVLPSPAVYYSWSVKSQQ